ncbi:MAG TPA: MipA/OmpV family protein [Cellvibrio sp.]|nr:MipA/OmpV family protein [Cellvibrio sp.]
MVTGLSARTLGFVCCNLFLLCVAWNAVAGDLSSDVRKGASGPDEGNGGYIEAGAGLTSYTSAIAGVPEGNEKGEVHTEIFLDVNARYQYHGWFMELFSQSLEQFTIGYNFYNGYNAYNNDGNWALDWVALGQHDEMSAEEADDYRGLDTRRGDYMSGLRATAYYGNYIVQMHALTDISRTHYGELASLKLARYWQHRNWNFHGIVGATYRSQDITDYYFSIHADEASAKYPEYEAPPGWSYVMEVGATYPLSEKWVFRGYVRRTGMESTFTASPLILDDHGDTIATAISYVF